MKAEDIGSFYVRNRDQQMVPLSTLVQADPSFGPAFTNRYNLFRSVEVLGSPAPGYSSGAGDGRGRGGREARCCPADMTYEWTAMSYQEEKAGGSAGHLRALDLLRVPDPGGALRELVAALERAAHHADRHVRRLPRHLDARARQRRVLADRADHADRAGREERDPDRRVREAGAREGRASRWWRRADRREAAPASDPDDELRLHPRLRAALDRRRAPARSRARASAPRW